jgi:hypothetical protein
VDISGAAKRHVKIAREVYELERYLRLAQEFLSRLGSDAEPVKIAELFSENMEFEIAGDTGVLPWIGKKSGTAGDRRFHHRLARHDRADQFRHP